MPILRRAHFNASAAIALAVVAESQSVGIKHRLIPSLLRNGIILQKIQIILRKSGTHNPGNGLCEKRSALLNEVLNGRGIGMSATYHL
jgi:hypothetical protein